MNIFSQILSGLGTGLKRAGQGAIRGLDYGVDNQVAGLLQPGETLSPALRRQLRGMLLQGLGTGFDSDAFRASAGNRIGQIRKDAAATAAAKQREALLQAMAPVAGEAPRDAALRRGNVLASAGYFDEAKKMFDAAKDMTPESDQMFAFENIPDPNLGLKDLPAPGAPPAFGGRVPVVRAGISKTGKVLNTYGRALPETVGGAKYDPSTGQFQTAPQPNAYTLSPGQTRYENGQVVASVPGAPPPANSPFAAARAQKERELGRAMTSQELIALQRQVSPVQPPASMLPYKGGLPAEGWDRVKDLNTMFRADPAVKNYAEIISTVNNVRSAANESRGSKTPGVGDLTIVRGLAKLNDPQTGIREEEARAYEGLGGLVQEAKNWIPRIERGQRLTPELRDAFVRMAEMIAENRTTQYQQTVQFFEHLANQAGVSKEQVIPDLSNLFRNPTGPASGSPRKDWGSQYGF